VSDERLRRAEQAARAGGVENGAAYLRELMRVGATDTGRLRIAAFCGHRPSALAIEWEPKHAPGICPCHDCASDPGAFGPWLSRLLEVARNSGISDEVIRVGRQILGNPLDPYPNRRPPGGWQANARKRVLEVVLGDHAWINA